MTTIKYYVEANGSKSPLIDAYESINGWYWYITEKHGNTWFGCVKGFETEWGDIWKPELNEQIKKGHVWKVPKEAWSFMSLVKREEATD
jgi:hypothetical protein